MISLNTFANMPTCHMQLTVTFTIMFFKIKPNNEQMLSQEILKVIHCGQHLDERRMVVYSLGLFRNKESPDT